MNYNSLLGSKLAKYFNKKYVIIYIGFFNLVTVNH